MISLARFALVMVCAAAAGGMPLLAAAQSSPAPSPSPAGSPAPAGATVSDPCASLSDLVSRPTFSTAACAVKPHDLLIETGYTNLTTKGAGATSAVSYPQAMLRVGAAKNLEVDFAAPSYERQSTAPAVSGTSDAGIGVKYELGYTSKLTYGVNVLYTLNTGSPAFSANGDGILANLNAALSLAPAFGLFGTVGYNAQSSGPVGMPQRYHGFDPSLGGTLSLPQSFDVFLEGFGQSSTGPGLGGRYGFDTGFQKDVGSRLQLDVEYYDFPSEQNGTRQSSVGFGASYLFGS